MSVQFLLEKLGTFPYYQEIMVFFGGFCTKILYDLYDDWKGNKKDEKARDRSLFIGIQNVTLPLNMMTFLRDFNSQKSFHKEEIDPLMRFVNTEFRDHKLKFFNKKLEKVRVHLFQSVTDIINHLSMETFTLTTNIEYQAVPKEWMVDYPERYKEITSILENKASLAWESYEEFLELGRKQLKI